MGTAAQQVGGELLVLAADWLAANKSEVLALADKGIEGADAQVKDAVNKGLTGHGVFGSFVTGMQKPVDTAIDALAATGEADASAFFDEAVAALKKEASAV